MALTQPRELLRQVLTHENTHDVEHEKKAAQMVHELRSRVRPSVQPKRKKKISRLLVQEGSAIDQHIREGRFQRSLSLITAFSSLLAGLEVTYEHYRGSYGQRIMYTPVILGLAGVIAGVWATFNRWAARVLMPIVSLLILLDGVVGFFFHIRGIQRKPGGWRLPIFNIIMGPPLFAPLLFGICGLLGLIAAFLRREDDPPSRSVKQGQDVSAWSALLPSNIRREEHVFANDVREGRFQRMLAAATAISVFFSGIEALYSHYKNNFSYKVQWTPVLLTPLLMIGGFGAVWSKWCARTLLPFASLLALLNGGIGFLYHMRGVMRRPGGLKKPWYNILYGPPIFAPLLFAASGFLGILASLLRREK